jgi:TusA-related sulfurtransferase
MTADEVPIVVDSLGTACPIPVIDLAKAVERAPAGTLLELLSDDEGAKVDIPVWCRMKRHEYLGREDRERGWAFLVRVVPR